MVCKELIYDKFDILQIGPKLHDQCSAMKEEKCENLAKFIAKKKNKRKKAVEIDSGSRIVGGNKAQHPMPWMVIVAIGEGQCGGSLINSQFVLSAAHCFCTHGRLNNKLIFVNI